MGAPDGEHIQEDRAVFRPALCQHSRAIYESNRFGNTKQQVMKGDKS